MRLDLALFHIVNGLCGNFVLDRVAGFEEGNQLFKGGLFLAAYWWYWFIGGDERRRNNRRVIVGAIVGALVALICARALAEIMPFRVRPMYAVGIGYHAPSIDLEMNMENWSAFPSDTATFWFAMSFGLFMLNRSVGIAAMVYSTLWMCLVRLYLGMHYPSDILAGAVIGISVAWATQKAFAARARSGVGQLAQRFLSWLDSMERDRPRMFYAAAFLISFELTVMFDDVRNLVRGTMHVLRVGSPFKVDETIALLVLAGCGAIFGLATILAVTLGRRLRRARMRTRSVRARERMSA
jgi:membrane-associated phospholipid phosphatase